MKNLAIRVRAARDAGRKWDGPGGIAEDPSFPEINSAIQGRKLLREISTNTRTAEGPSAESYERRYAAALAELRPLTECDVPETMRALAGTDDDELPLFGRFPA